MCGETEDQEHECQAAGAGVDLQKCIGAVFDREGG